MRWKGGTIVCTFAMPPEVIVCAPQAVERARTDAGRVSAAMTMTERAEVEDDVDDARALGVRLRADGADDGGGHAVADVHADDDGVDRAERQRARHGKRLQDADGRRRALNAGRQRPYRARKPSTGASARPVEHLRKRRATHDSGLTAAVMFRRPVKRMPKPIAMLPTVSTVRRLDGHDEEDARRWPRGARAWRA